MRRVLLLLAVALAWVGLAAPALAGLSVSVDLATQTMRVATSDGESHLWKISSGRQGYRTIRGQFRPVRLEKRWYSRKYGGNMPNAVFFKGGFAIHGTGEVSKLGRPASHGCVRLHPANAARLFALVQKHGKSATRIAINGVAPDTGSRFAKAATPGKAVASVRVKKAKTQLAAKKAAPSWETARERMFLRPAVPANAMGFQPVKPAR